MKHIMKNATARLNSILKEFRCRDNFNNVDTAGKNVSGSKDFNTFSELW